MDMWQFLVFTMSAYLILEYQYNVYRNNLVDYLTHIIIPDDDVAQEF